MELKPYPYIEIVKLFDYCKKIGVSATLEKLFDGYAIRFPCGGDFIQHRGSYGCQNGCVEPAIGSRLDYTAVSLKSAKSLVRRHKERLNRMRLCGGTWIYCDGECEICTRGMSSATNTTEVVKDRRESDETD